MNDLKKHWEQITKEPITIEKIGSMYYAFGTELACLRLLHKYQYSIHLEKVKCAYSASKESWYFVLYT